jgi:dTDP-4-amino-4,6-dideoxy-D-galactose acyltransferase
VRPASASAPAVVLDWDSAFWGFRIGRVVGEGMTAELAAALEAWAAEEAVSCLYFLTPADDHETVDSAQQARFRFVDVRLELNQPFSPVEPTRLVRPYEHRDLDALRAIAQTSHEITRFYADPRFPRARCRELYDTWIVRSCEEGFADGVLVADIDGRAVGYVTCDYDEGGRSGSIGLIAVADSERGAGLGDELVRGALHWMNDRGAAEAHVVTQGANVAAQRTFQRAGFRTSSVKLWFHCWYER